MLVLGILQPLTSQPNPDEENPTNPLAVAYTFLVISQFFWLLAGVSRIGNRMDHDWLWRLRHTSMQPWQLLLGCIVGAAFWPLLLSLGLALGTMVFVVAAKGDAWTALAHHGWLALLFVLSMYPVLQTGSWPALHAWRRRDYLGELLLMVLVFFHLAVALGAGDESVWEHIFDSATRSPFDAGDSLGPANCAGVFGVCLFASALLAGILMTRPRERMGRPLPPLAAALAPAAALAVFLLMTGSAGGLLYYRLASVVFATAVAAAFLVASQDTVPMRGGWGLLLGLAAVLAPVTFAIAGDVPLSRQALSSLLVLLVFRVAGYLLLFRRLMWRRWVWLYPTAVLGYFTLECLPVLAVALAPEEFLPPVQEFLEGSTTLLMLKIASWQLIGIGFHAAVSLAMLLFGALGLKPRFKPPTPSPGP